MIATIESSLFKKPSWKSRYLKYLNDFITSLEVKLPSVPVSSWSSWFETAMYPCYQSSSLGGFHRAEKGVGMAVERIIELVSHKTTYPEIILQLYFIKENCQWLMTVLTAFEEMETPMACKAFDVSELWTRN